jgi:hypothetical protein
MANNNKGQVCAAALLLAVDGPKLPRRDSKTRRMQIALVSSSSRNPKRKREPGLAVGGCRRDEDRTDDSGLARCFCFVSGVPENRMTKRQSKNLDGERHDDIK